MGTSSLLGALVGLLRGDMSEHLEAVKLSAPPISPGAGIHAGVGPSLIDLSVFQFCFFPNVSFFLLFYHRSSFPQMRKYGCGQFLNFIPYGFGHLKRTGLTLSPVHKEI